MSPLEFQLLKPGDLIRFGGREAVVVSKGPPETGRLIVFRWKSSRSRSPQCESASECEVAKVPEKR